MSLQGFDCLQLKNNLHTKVAHFVETCSESLHCGPLTANNSVTLRASKKCKLWDVACDSVFLKQFLKVVYGMLQRNVFKDHCIIQS